MDDPASVTSEPVAPAARVVKRTYGRKKDAPAAIVDEALATTTSPQNSTTLLGEKKDITSDHEGSPESSGSPGLKHDFGWKARMKELDKLYADDDDDVVNKSAKVPSAVAPLADPPAMEDDSFTTANSSIFDAAPPRESSPATSEESPMPQNLKKRKAKPMPSVVSDDDRQSPSPSTKATASSSRIRRKNIDSESSESDGENETKPVVKVIRTSASPVTANSDQDAQEPGPSKQKKRRVKTSDKADKIKKPSKKDELESKKAHARMMAEQQASVRKTSKILELDDFFGKIQKPQATLDSKPQPLQRQPSSDPIQQFSSPARGPHNEIVTKPKPLQTNPSFPKTLEDSDEELVDVKDILQHDKVRKNEVEEKEKRRKRLAMQKQKVIELQARKLASDNQSDGESDDDLEIENVEGGSKSKGKQYSLESKVRPGRKSWPEDLRETQVLQAAAQPHFNARPTGKSNRFEHKNLLQIMRNKGVKQSEDITKEKQALWIGKGGKLKQKSSAPSGGDTLAMVVEKLRKSTQGQTSEERGEGEGGDEDGSDEDWDPQNEGSGSETSLSGEDKENAPTQQVADATVDERFEDGEDGEDENSYPKQRVGRRSAHRHGGRAVVSDEENEGSSLRAPRILVPDTSMVLDSPSVLNQGLPRRTSISSMEDTSFDENDNKENDMSLMFDQGEDKENLAVPRLHSPSRWALNNSQNRSIFDLADGMRQRLSMSPSNPGPSSSSKRIRQPLQQRKLDDLDMDDEFPPLSATVVGSDSPTRAHPSSASSSPKPLQPAFGGSLGGFTQLFNDEDGGGDENMPPPKNVLKPAFSFTSSSSGDSQPRPLQFGGPLSFSASPTQKTFGGIKPFGDGTKELSLTLDTKLQPALEVNSQVRRKADAIFEREQNFVLEEAAQKPQSKPVLYVTETGLLTQTRPDVSTPVVYRSATQNNAPPDSIGTLPPSSTQRLPLSTLSFTSDITSPTQPTRLSRLRKGARPPSISPQATEKVGSPSKNAFVRMLEAQSKQHARKEEAKNLEKSLFVEGEAHESDEDEEFGFGKKKSSKSDEEDSDDDDENAVIENLVDDSKKEEEREDLVLEKVQEHREHDDQELEKYHMKAVEGKLRGKRRGGRVGLSDSESEDEDDDARRLRQRIHKKRRVAGDTLEALGKDEKSEAFVRGYEEDLHDDAFNDFAHLVQDDMEVDSDEENEEPVETVNASDLQAELRMAAQNTDKGKQRFDPENADWVERTNWSDDDENFGVKDVEMPRKSAVGSRRYAPGQDGEMGLYIKRGEWDGAQLEAWRKEQSNRNFGGTRVAGAVTGHGKKNASSSKSSRMGTAPVSQGAEKRGVAKSASALAVVSSKQSRFESA